MSPWLRRLRGFLRQLLRLFLFTLVICAALTGLGLVFNPPRPGPPRPQGAVTRVYKKGD